MAELPSGTLTFVFTDLVDSTRLWEEHAAAMAKALSRHDEILRNAIETQGGAVIKSTGDGGYSVFESAPAAVAACADAARALATETWGETGPLRVRFGLHSGEAELRDGDYFGQPLNRASRLMGAAHGGQIVMSQRTYDLARDSLPDDRRLIDLGEHRFPGLTRTEHVYQLAIAGLTADFPPLHSSAASPGALALAVPVIARDDKPLVGRSTEMARLVDMLDRVDDHGRWIVAISGEPGIGTTRLAGAFARHARAHGAVVLYGRCDEEPACAYQPFVEALRPYIAACSPRVLRECVHGMEHDLARVFPDLAGRLEPPAVAPPSDPETARYRLFEAFSTLLCALAQPQRAVLVLDDLHCADKATLQLLRHVERATVNARLIVIGCYRDVRVRGDDSLGDYLADLRSDPASTRIVLGGLSLEETEELVRERVDLTPSTLAALHSATGGNPYFLTELVRHLAESHIITRGPQGDSEDRIDLEDFDLPDSVRDVITRRLRRLPPVVTDLLDVAAVCGREFDGALVARAAAKPLDDVLNALDLALEAKLIEEEPTRPGHYKFVNTVIRQGLYHDMSRAKRARLHARVGASIEMSAQGTYASATLGHHFRYAVPVLGADKAIEYAALAGRDALADFAFDEAVAQFDDALALLEEHAPKDSARRVELLIDRASALVYIDERKGVTAAREAVQCARDGGSPSQFGRAVAVFVEPSYGAAAFPDETAQLFDEARRVLGESNAALRARLSAYESFKYAVHQLRGRDGRAIAAESVALARDAGDSLTLADALFSLAVNREGTPAIAERVQLGEELMALGQPAGGRATAFGLRVLAGAQLELADGDALAKTISTLEHLGQRLRWLPAKVYATQWEATVALLQGRWNDVRTRGHELRELTPAYNGAAGMQTVQAFHMDRELGEPSIAVGMPVEDLPAADLYARASIALAEVDVGNYDAARHALDMLAAEGFSRGDTGRNGAALALFAEVAASTGACEHADQLYAGLVPHSGHVLSTLLGLACIGGADRYLGMLATLRNDWAEAHERFTAATDIEQRLQGRALLPRTRYWHARMLRARGEKSDRVAAAALLEDVAAETQALQMRTLHAQCVALQRA